MMTPERYQQIRQLFLNVCELESDQQDEYLAEHCGEDDDLRAEVERLLVEQTKNGTASLKPSIPDGVADELSEQLVGQTIGRYRITRVIDSGGMGAVYEAMQDVPERAVAVKVIKPGIATAEMLRRFEHEAQVLGRLNHPGIAQIYEAGTFDLGSGQQPFFAMELIEGKSLLDHVSDAELGTRQRLEMMSKVCHAVQHAHQKGIIHRDLKPGNIMVDQWGQPKVLDFGVARTTNADIRNTSLGTGLGRFIGTVAYMSPEQAAGDPDEIDVRSDVYALGVICYEMLAGRLPYEIDRKMIHEAARVIREEDPTPLSSTNRTFRGDLETIITKALEKEKDRRYQSVAELAADIERYLRNEPIVARPPSTWYQTRKFAQRNRALVIGAGAVFGVLIAGIIVSSMMYVQAEVAREETAAERDRALQAEAIAAEQRRIAEDNERRAVREAERAQLAEAETEQRARELEQVVDFHVAQLSEIDTQLMGVHFRARLVEKLEAALYEQGGLDKIEVEQHRRTFEQMLARINFTDVAAEALAENLFGQTILAVEEQFAEQPLVHASLLESVGVVFHELGLHDRGRQPLEHALTIRREHLGEEHEQTFHSMSQLGRVLMAAGDLESSEAFLKEAYDRRQRHLGDDHPSTLTSLSNLGVLHFEKGEYATAEKLYRQALKRRHELFGRHHPDTLDVLHNLGAALRRQGQWDDAEQYLTEALAGSRVELGKSDPRTLRTLGELTKLRMAQGRLDEAAELARQSLDAWKIVKGGLHPETLNARNSLAVTLYTKGDFEAAEHHMRPALDVSAELLGVDHPRTLTMASNLSMALMSLGSYADAEPFAQQALNGRRQVLGDDHPDTIASVNNMARVLRALGRDEDAVKYYREAMRHARRTFGAEHELTLITSSNLSSILRGLGRLEEAHRLTEDVVKLARRTISPDHWHLGQHVAHYGRLLTMMERFDESEASLLEAHDILESSLGPTHNRTIHIIEHLADLYEAWHEDVPDAGHDTRAAEWRSKLGELQADSR